MFLQKSVLGKSALDRQNTFGLGTYVWGLFYKGFHSKLADAFFRINQFSHHNLFEVVLAL